MKRIIIILVLFMFFSVGIKAQQSEVYIYNEGGNTTIYNKVNNNYMVLCSNSAEENALINFFPRKRIVTPGRIIVTTSFDSISGYVASSNGNIIYSDILISQDFSVVHWGTNRLFVKVKPDISIYELLSDNEIPYSNYEQFGSDNYVYLVTLNSQKDVSVEYANMLFSTGDVVYSHPDFGVLMKGTQVASDYYSSQWGLNNTGQYGGIAGYDINAPRAWNYSDGATIKVAVLDDGIDIMHDDLSQNLLPGYDATDNALGGGLFGECKYDDPHGTACAGIIAAADNNFGIKGVAYKSNIIPIRIAYNIIDTVFGGLSWLTYYSWAADAIYKSWHDLGADVLSCSWGGGDSSDIIKTEIINAYNYGRNEKGCPIVFSSGNYYCNNPFSWPLMGFPANQKDYVIAVGAASPCGEWKNCSSCDLERDWASCLGLEMSVVAPGVKIFTTDLNGVNGYNSLAQTDSNYYDNDYYATFNGTSAACPHVSGVAALILSANPNLTARQVRDIIEKTAQKVRSDLYTYDPPNTDHPNGSWNYRTGYGMVDAYNSVKAAKGYDLFVSDIQNDGGNNNSNLQILDSPDIWLRRNNDNGTNHQPGSNGTNYLKVRINNNGPASSVSGTDTLRVFFKHATLENSMSWIPTQWQECTPVAIPEVPANGSVILTIPINFSVGLNNTFEDYAFYVRIDSPFDNLNASETTTLLNNVKNNNNIAAKNVAVSKYIIAADCYGLGANVNLAHIPNATVSSTLRINTSNNGNNILDEAEVSLVFLEDLMDDWLPSSENLKKISDNTFLVKGETLEFANIPETDFYIIYNFLTRRNTNVNTYKNNINQFVVIGDDEEIIGCLTIQVDKPERAASDRFHANAGNDTAVLLNTTATLHATQINENATYRWYDKQRNFLYEGVNYSATPSQTSEYILEVTAESDGYRDLDTVKVTVVPGCIRSITPNPVADNWVNVSYEYATTVNSARLFIYNTGTTTLVGNYDLSNLGNVSSLDIVVTNYPIGSYTIVLVCDNTVCQSKVLIRE